jgi:hypothetical protein
MHPRRATADAGGRAAGTSGVGVTFAHGHERVRVVRRGREIAAIVPIEDVEFLERLEDGFDVEEARAVLADPESANPIPWEQVKADLGL